jgi:Flp pilus assembly protein CpaB
MRSKSTLVALLVCITFTALGIGSYVLYGSIFSEKPAAPAEPAVRIVSVVVAKKSLPMGTLIKVPEKYFELREIPANVAPKHGYTDLEAIKGVKLMKPIGEDTPLTSEDVLEKGGNSWAEHVPQWHLPVTISVNAEGCSAGFVQPLIRVDIVFHFGFEEKEYQPLVENVLMVAIDGCATRDPKRPSRLIQQVTLAVMPWDAVKLWIAEPVGDFKIFLRRPDESTTILVAKKRLEVGLRIDDPADYFERKVSPPSDYHENAPSTFGAIKGCYLIKSLNEGEVLTCDDLLDREAQSLVATVPQGYRAVPIKLSSDRAAEGFILPMSRVDVLSVTRQQDGTNESKVLLANLLVLAVDVPAKLNRDEKEPRAATVTVACKPEDAEKLAQAARNGELKVVLSKEDDERIGKLQDGVLRVAMSHPDDEDSNQLLNP